MLNIDKFFYKCLADDTDIRKYTSERVFSTARTVKDENEDKIPYIIVQYAEGGSDGGTKDNGVMAPLNNATVDVLICAKDRNALADLTQLAHDNIEAYLDVCPWDKMGWGFEIENCYPTAHDVLYDPQKPCLYQTLSYRCETKKLKHYERPESSSGS